MRQAPALVSRLRSCLSCMTEVRTVTNLAAAVATVTSSDAPVIGVLALQGGFHEHMVMLSNGDATQAGRQGVRGAASA